VAWRQPVHHFVGRGTRPVRHHRVVAALVPGRWNTKVSSVTAIDDDVVPSSVVEPDPLGYAALILVGLAILVPSATRLPGIPLHDRADLLALILLLVVAPFARNPRRWTGRLLF